MNNKKYFNKVANKWDSMRQVFYSDSIRKKAMIVSGVNIGDTAADIGAGTGFMSEVLLDNHIKVVAVDHSEEMISVLKQKFGQNTRIKFILANAEQMNISNNSVDYVFANMYLHHTEDPESAIKEMSRILKPGGKMIITDLDVHNNQFLKIEQNDNWLGFNREDIKKWFLSAKLTDVIVDGLEERCVSNSNTSENKADISIFIAYGIKN